jgi:hypothetical protein
MRQYCGISSRAASVRRSSSCVLIPLDKTIRSSLHKGTSMNKKFAVAWLVVFLVWFFSSFTVHGVALHGDYAALPNLFRTEADSQKYFPLMLLAHVIMSGALVWIYQRGAESKPWAPQGVRFGIALTLLTNVPVYMIYFVVQPMPGKTVVKQIVYDSVLAIVLGLVVAFMCRDTAKA